MKHCFQKYFWKQLIPVNRGCCCQLVCVFVRLTVLSMCLSRLPKYVERISEFWHWEAKVLSYNISWLLATCHGVLFLCSRFFSVGKVVGMRVIVWFSVTTGYLHELMYSPHTNNDMRDRTCVVNDLCYEMTSARFLCSQTLKRNNLLTSKGTKEPRFWSFETQKHVRPGLFVT